MDGSGIKEFKFANALTLGIALFQNGTHGITEQSIKDARATNHNGNAPRQLHGIILRRHGIQDQGSARRRSAVGKGDIGGLTAALNRIHHAARRHCRHGSFVLLHQFGAHGGRKKGVHVGNFLGYVLHRPKRNKATLAITTPTTALLGCACRSASNGSLGMMMDSLCVCVVCVGSARLGSNGIPPHKPSADTSIRRTARVHGHDTTHSRRRCYPTTPAGQLRRRRRRQEPEKTKWLDRTNLYYLEYQ